MLGRWIKEAENEDGQVFWRNGKLTPDQEKILKLKAQVKRLEMEREILKKSTGFFAKETLRKDLLFIPIKVLNIQASSTGNYLITMALLAV
ncbi:MAG: transposase-like protein [Paraglaciecola sp.]|jgi:transposase-like protein